MNQIKLSQYNNLLQNIKSQHRIRYNLNLNNSDLQAIQDLIKFSYNEGIKRAYISLSEDEERNYKQYFEDFLKNNF